MKVEYKDNTDDPIVISFEPEKGFFKGIPQEVSMSVNEALELSLALNRLLVKRGLIEEG